MDSVLSILFGVVQGLTEFLPISSSGHLVLLHRFVSLPVQDELVFDVALHAATGLAVIVFFASDLSRYAVAFCASLVRPRLHEDDHQRLAWYLVIGTIPAGLAGYFFEETIEHVLRSEFVVVAMLMIVAFVFIAVERRKRLGAELSELTVLDTMIIGCAQALALIPGTSRSGITIIAGMMRGLKREQATRFSFLLSAPIIVAASAKKIVDVAGVGIPREEIALYLLAFASAFATGIFAIRFLLNYLENHSLAVFAVYRILLAVGIVLVLFVNR